MADSKDRPSWKVREVCVLSCQWREQFGSIRSSQPWHLAILENPVQLPESGLIERGLSTRLALDAYPEEGFG
jgi:hypothetical protein